jgi:hypothetical protein|tara:strand:+ start:172 stop:444 length:273 start_codon:yes stop_codon:yes gene_type:complete
MLLQINEKYAIESNATGWAVSEFREEPKAGNFWKQIAWYSTLENAANGLLQREIRCLEVDTLNDAIKGVEGLARELVGALSPEYEITKKG